MEPLAPSDVSPWWGWAALGWGDDICGLSGWRGPSPFCLSWKGFSSTAPNQLLQDRELCDMAGGWNLTSSFSLWSVLEEHPGYVTARCYLTLAPTPSALGTALAVTALRQLLTKAATCKSTKGTNPTTVLEVYDSSDGGTPVEEEIL